MADRQEQKSLALIAVGPALLMLVAVFGPWLWSALTADTFAHQDLLLGSTSPNLRHPFGTDFFGRDIFIRTLFGLRISLAIGLCAALISVVVGWAVGCISGYLGGAWDAAIMRLVDVLTTLPFMFVVIMLVTIAGRSLLLLFVALGLVGWLSTARLVRAQVLALKEQDFVAALITLGATHLRVIAHHLIPNTQPTVILSFTLTVPSMVLEEAFLSFLGLGVQPPTPSLGSLINEGASNVLQTPWQLVGPTLVLVIVLVTLNLTGDTLHRWADTRSQKP